MSCWSLIPIKARTACKMRLAELLTPESRLKLVRAMFAHVLEAVRQAPGIDQVAIVSSDWSDLPRDVVAFADPGLGLNDALKYAACEAQRRGATRIVIVPADLPLLNADDLTGLITASEPSGFAIAPDRWEYGTNGLCVSPAAAFGFHFGPGSLQHHLAEAAAHGVSPAMVRSRGLAFDVDQPSDFHALFGQRPVPKLHGPAHKERFV
jgi:2-phospho-L-lactate guanylyltransferase